jgi:hypothetical protein
MRSKIVDWIILDNESLMKVESSSEGCSEENDYTNMMEM